MHLYSERLVKKYKTKDNKKQEYKEFTQRVVDIKLIYGFWYWTLQVNEHLINILKRRTATKDSPWISNLDKIHKVPTSLH